MQIFVKPLTSYRQDHHPQFFLHPILCHHDFFNTEECQSQRWSGGSTKFAASPPNRPCTHAKSLGRAVQHLTPLARMNCRQRLMLFSLPCLVNPPCILHRWLCPDSNQTGVTPISVSLTTETPRTRPFSMGTASVCYVLPTKSELTDGLARVQTSLTESELVTNVVV